MQIVPLSFSEGYHALSRSRIILLGLIFSLTVAFVSFAKEHSFAFVALALGLTGLSGASDEQIVAALDTEFQAAVGQPVKRVPFTNRK
jgi:uncharacterized membrane protein YqhA